MNSPVATFFTGYAAFRHADFAAAKATLSKLSGASPDLTARARFLLAEIAYEDFKGVGAQGDVASTIDMNVKALAAVDRAYKPVIEAGDAPWAMFGVARLAAANAKFAAVLRGIEPPAGLSPQDQKTLKTALEAQAATAEKRANELKGLCVKQAKKS